MSERCRMPLQPEEVRARRFRVALFGYRRRDVNSFLRRVAWDYKSALDASTGADCAAADAREVERLLRRAHESTELLRLVAALETGRERARASSHNGALTGYRLVKVAEVLLAAADALEHAHRLASHRNDAASPSPRAETDTVEVVGGSRNGSRTTPVTQIALALPPPPPPGVSGTVRAPG
jgi:DivIVA domain-containing protein